MITEQDSLRPQNESQEKPSVSVSQMFEDFCGQLVLPQTLRSSISTRTGRVVGRLNSDFRNSASDTANRFYAGSYGRSTAVPGISDIDLICILPYETYAQYNAYGGNKQSSLLQAVRASLNNTYPNSAVIADGQIVKINFTDGITYEIVPVFLNKDGSYTYADSNNGGSWKTCKPKHEIDSFLERDAQSNRNLVVLGRMVRAWRDNNNVGMSGMLIDTLAYQFIENYEHRGQSFLYHDFMARDFFDFLSKLDMNQTWWRAPGSGAYVSRKGVFQHKARSAFLRSVEAIQYNDTTYDWSRRQKWREVFGPLYPS